MLLVGIYVVFATFFVGMISAVPPATGSTFCADVRESLTINGTFASENKFNLCMNSESLIWKKTNIDGSWQLLNKYLYTITARGECTYTIPPPSDASQLPWSFVTIDKAAHIDGTGSSPGSNILSTKYYHDRKSYNSQGVSVPEEMMYWYVIPGTVPDSDGSIPDQMIETVCKQTYDVSPGDGGTSTVQYGDRDFSSNFSVAAAHEEETFTIPSNMQCQEQDQVDNETHSKYGVFGPVLF
jgi:hypothetical protein